MAEHSSIEWTHSTWNPWHGCRKVSAGCRECYMFRDKKRYGQDPTVVVRSTTKFQDPLKWAPEYLQAEAKRRGIEWKPGDPWYVFTCSWSDWFIEEADVWRAEAWEIIKATPHLTYQILTKRPERIAKCLPADWGAGYPNVWLGVSVEDQKTANVRVPHLLQIPARIHFVSAEPLLEAVDLTQIIDADLAQLNALTGFWRAEGKNEPARNRYGRLDLVIVGGESGPKARPLDVEWVRSIVKQCHAAGVAVFVKQMGQHWATEERRRYRPTIGQAASLRRDPKGSDPLEWPEDLRVREWPR
jgi:protein gp37